MNTSDYIKHEAAEITGRTGRYIPPWRMANLMKSAQKITDFLVKSDIAMTYEECEIVLNIVLRAIKDLTGREDN